MAALLKVPEIMRDLVDWSFLSFSLRCSGGGGGGGERGQCIMLCNTKDYQRCTTDTFYETT